VALVAVELPRVGLVMENARLVRWLRNVGDLVRQGDPLLEVETEKAVVEIESTHSGRLVEILLHVDEQAHVGDRVAWLETNAVTAADVMRRAQPAPLGATAARGPPASIACEQAQDMASVDQERNPRRIRSSPAARRLAARHAVALGGLAGSGPGGRVQLRDVQRQIETRAAQTAAALPAARPRPLSSMRRALARSMTLSSTTVPQFVVERAVDWTALQALRAKLIAELPAGAVRPSVNDFLLQAIARALHSCASLNATFSGNADSPDAALVPAQGTHIGLVVAVEDGLLVPVFHGAEQLGLAELARRRSETVARALQGKLKREELEGATISVSNLGARGPDRFTALINPPQAAILAVGRQRDCVVAINGHMHVRPMSQLTLTVDHRVADGRLAADFLATLTAIVEGDAWRVA
jgi:pyruvate dehydrogenase E2 component (dihydrolipoyllysine-residue acetyltransferase)